MIVVCRAHVPAEFYCRRCAPYVSIPEEDTIDRYRQWVRIVAASEAESINPWVGPRRRSK